MQYEENGTLQELTEEKWNSKVSRLLNKMENYSKWIRNKYRNASVKEKMIYVEKGTLQEVTEKKWNDEVNRLANLAMVPYERKNIMKFINFRFNWKGSNKVREANS
jgi:hypothetical protein